MFSKLQIGALALFVLSISQLARGRVMPEPAPEHLNRVVVRLVVRASAPCSSCVAPVTVTVSGTLSATPASTAVTVSVGFDTSIASPSATSSGPIAGSTTETTANVVSSATAAATAAATSTASTSTIGNFGSCSIPEIEFGTGFDGRKETSFQPVDRTSYNHASAQTISVITQAICDALTNSCGADATAKATCTRAQSAADAATPGQGIDADIFNGFFDISTNFAAVPAVAEQSSTITPTTVASTLTAAATTTTLISAETTSSAAPPASSAPPAPAATASGNLQGFTGNLGGVAAPAVVVSGSQFQVEGNSLFKTKTEALARSCDVQQNDCANAANASGNKGGFTVTACGTQKTACNAANG
ncbi:hypothetical protein B0H17DRAFT_1033579 [Mycena rosella]|uniref:Uncharacterized protein n=1 Tax=Mycena rosella TaxID=1033263 RepID=A0AAD7GY40_MYCRO|nr:hypothetical protein B0H17DRAFT_1033579 [Mycena rosella]